MDPPSTLLCDMHPYQKQALGWMSKFEKGGRNGKGIKNYSSLLESLSNCWKVWFNLIFLLEYETKVPCTFYLTMHCRLILANDRRVSDVYVNSLSGKAMPEFPSAHVDNKRGSMSLLVPLHCQRKYDCYDFSLSRCFNSHFGIEFLLVWRFWQMQWDLGRLSWQFLLYLQTLVKGAMRLRVTRMNFILILVWSLLSNQVKSWMKIRENLK